MMYEGNMAGAHQGTAIKDLLSLRGLIEDAPLLAEAIVDTVQDSVLLLDPQLKVILANRSFYVTFGVEPSQTLERMVYELGDGQWDIPELTRLLEDILPNNHSFSGYEVAHAFPTIGRKVMRLNARKLRRREDQPDLILLAIEDITAIHEREAELQQSAREKELLVHEIHHRVKNNFQTIAALLRLQSDHTENPDLLAALAEAKGRLAAMARLHESLHASKDLSHIHIGDYLQNLVTNLRSLHDRAEIAFDVNTADLVLDMDQATPLALIANELILNCFKHAFPNGRAGNVAVSLQYVASSAAHSESVDDRFARLEVNDNGVGFSPEVDPEQSKSMGLELVRMLSRQIHAERKCVVADGVQWTITFPIF